MKIYLVRHAQCLSNQGLKIAEHNHLTERGKEQARRLGTYFKGIKINKVLCSTSHRTKETLSYILPHLENPEVEYTDKIREHNIGLHYGKDPNFPKQYLEDIKNSGKSFYEFKSEDGESYLELQKRAQDVWGSIKKNELENILLVTHQQFSKCFIIHLLGLDISEEKYFKIGNASVSKLNMDKSGKVKNFDVSDIHHLLKEGVKNEQSNNI